jgi:fatty-acyl-CoA synthase
VVPAEGKTLTAEELVQFLVGRVSRMWLPERWAFMDSLPKTSVGKFDKKALRTMFAEGKLDVVTVEVPSEK